MERNGEGERKEVGSWRDTGKRGGGGDKRKGWQERETSHF